MINCDHLNMDAFKDVLVKFDKRFLPQDGRKVVIDMKTIGSNAWKNQVLSRGVHKDYIIQLISYIHLLNCDYGIVIYENKDDSQLALFKIERNDNLWGVIKFQLEEMVKMRETGSLPYPKATSKIDNMCKDEILELLSCYKETSTKESISYYDTIKMFDVKLILEEDVNYEFGRIDIYSNMFHFNGDDRWLEIGSVGRTLYNDVISKYRDMILNKIL